MGTSSTAADASLTATVPLPLKGKAGGAVEQVEWVKTGGIAPLLSHCLQRGDGIGESAYSVDEPRFHRFPAL